MHACNIAAGVSPAGSATRTSSDSGRGATISKSAQLWRGSFARSDERQEPPLSSSSSSTIDRAGDQRALSVSLLR